MEPLHLMLKKANDQQLLLPIANRAANLRIGMFADAAAILINTVKDEVRIIQELLNSFGKASNLSKSPVFPIRCENVDLTDVMSRFQIPMPSQKFPVHIPWSSITCSAN
jgi:hypothetical protein